jgi:DNA-binding transcriptional MerR regulator/methylmalonyl-CoA mutase cobalamin-binding subunit
MNAQTMSIAAVERETGLSKDTLRVWERRYGFPLPGRDGHGERAYPADQVAKLRAVKRLLDVGHRPSQVVGMSIEALARLSESLPASRSLGAAPPSMVDVQALFQAIKAHDVKMLARLFTQTQARMGLSRFITDVVTPLTAQVGDAWMRGQLEIYEEHAYSEALQTCLRSALASLAEPTPSARPRVLLCTLTGELHGLGLLMAEAFLVLEGAHCTPLGTQMPLWDVVQAAQAFCSDVVALSFSPAAPATLVQDSLSDLRTKLPASVELWVGGSSPSLHRRGAEGLRVLHSLQQIPLELQRWRRDQLPGR